MTNYRTDPSHYLTLLHRQTILEETLNDLHFILPFTLLIYIFFVYLQYITSDNLLLIVGLIPIMLVYILLGIMSRKLKISSKELEEYRSVYYAKSITVEVVDRDKN